MPLDDAGTIPEVVEPAPIEARCSGLRPAHVPWSDPCYRSGTARAFLAGAGAATAGAGAWWFLYGGDSVSSGDPAGQWIGVGLVAGGGALLGSLATHWSGGREAEMPLRPPRPTVRMRLGLGGADALDEAAPVSLGLRVDPTFNLGSFQIQPHLGVSPGLFESADVDPRPQVAGTFADQDAAFPVALTERDSAWSLGAELAWRVTRAKHAGEEGYRPRFEVRYRPTLEVRRRNLHPGEADEQLNQHLALMPANVGFRWHLSPRQRFTAFLGPRLDWIAYSVPGSRDLVGSSRPLMGTLYAEGYYQVDTPLSRVPDGLGWEADGRLNLGYIHSNLDAMSYDSGAIIGFFGPVDVSYDLLLRRNDSRVVWQVTVGSTLGDGGAAYLELGSIFGGEL